MKSFWPSIALLGTATALPVENLLSGGTTIAPLPSPLIFPEVPRLALYFQTTHDLQGHPISMLPLVTEKNIALTHLIVCSFHINVGSNITLNDYPPHFPLFSTLWNETQIMKNSGIKVMGMVGGAAAGSFSRQTLDGNATTFERYYGQLRDAINLYGLQGMDLDVEQPMSQSGITRLVRRLRADFGPSFIITLSPVATALWGGGNLSGFDYKLLETEVGAYIHFYNAQFYNGWGDATATREFDQIVATGYPPQKVLVGQITTADNGGGFVEHGRLNETVGALRRKYGEIGGIMGWEYFNSQPGGIAQPWQWAQVMTTILRPDLVPQLRITKDMASGLIQAWKDSAVGVGGSDSIVGAVMPEVTPNVDYMAMVNA